MIPDPLSAAEEAGIDVFIAPGQATYTVTRLPEGAGDCADVTGIRVTAPTQAGLVWGAAQVLAEKAAGAPVTQGEFDPPYARRGLHVDSARHFFEPQHIHDLLHIMAWGRLNVMNLHLSENEGCRLPSQRHPEIMSEAHFSREDIRGFIEEGQRLGITVIPSIDMPGHLGRALEGNEWAQLRDQDGTPIRGALDILNPEAIAFAWDILDEAVELFGAEEVTIGGDEFLDLGVGVPALHAAAQERFGPDAAENDLWIDFVNRTVERLAAKGVRSGVWNDGIRGRRVVDLDRRALLHHWTRWGQHMAAPCELSDHDMVNWDADALYFVLRRDQLHLLPTFDSVWDNFEPSLFLDRVGHTRLRNVEGAVFSIWCDEPDALSTVSIVRLAKDPILAFACRCWPLGGLHGKAAVHSAFSAVTQEREGK
ncbi:family 20 glycosylhydrolase [Schaalia sp. 19OD2882]|uniref:family 20 glycosylhydrolase n=1 Tax=Schaalia sp. 19OD2882 TaxID=2794089 RepID=UPI001C1E9F47|nr:family 20 glycosylhydrolase [Schaalia sp. 19OD2882]QWW19992.1 family 20 glycosylhydrolase [Schaalia sp. 19OD2882]